MTVPDPTLQGPFERPGMKPENRQDVVPSTERNQDPARNEVEHDLSMDPSRPLTDEEKKAADRATPVAERVYAPASERVPVDPVPGHREVVTHTDTHTPEREAAGYVAPQSATTSSAEPSFTRVSRPSVVPTMETPTPGAYASSMSNPGFRTNGMDDEYSSAWPTNNRRKMFFGLGFGWFTVACTGVGVWLFMRWQRERNKPINRIRRQARHAAEELRERVPNPEDAAKPAMGLTTAVLSILVLMWQQAQARSKQADKVVSRKTGKASKRAEKQVGRATDKLTEIDWQKRLMRLKERWTPGRVELEKIQISRH